MSGACLVCLCDACWLACASLVSVIKRLLCLRAHGMPGESLPDRAKSTCHPKENRGPSKGT